MALSDRNILLYDYLLIKGGAEALTLDLVRGLDGFDLCVDYCDPKHFDKASLADFNCIELAPPTSLKGWRTLRGMQNFLHKTPFLRTYQTVIYSGNHAPLAVHQHPHGKNILYCHAIPRFAYDLEQYWLQRLPWWQKPAFKLLGQFTRHYYEPAVRKMDLIIANSENVRSRLKRYLGLEAVVVHPPCAIDKFDWIGQGDYYLSTGRLEPYKRVAEIVEAFKQMPDKKLVVTSGGSQATELRNLAKQFENIRFTGWVSDLELQELMGNCIASVYLPKDEDFGISAVESMAAGKPVIGVAEGGLKESVIHEETGYLITLESEESGFNSEKISDASPSITIDRLIYAVNWMSAEQAMKMRPNCEKRSQQFDSTKFLEKMRVQIKSVEMT